MLCELTRNKTWMLDGAFQIAPTLFFFSYAQYILFLAIVPIRSPASMRFFQINQLRLTKNFSKLTNVLVLIFRNVLAWFILRPQHSAQSPKNSRVKQFKIVFSSYWICLVGSSGSRLSIRIYKFRRNLTSHQGTVFLSISWRKRSWTNIRKSTRGSWYYSEHLKEVYDYFEDTYIGGLNRRHQRKTPQFQKSMWNVRSRTLQSIPRTTNKTEVWHRAIRRIFDTPHPSIYRFFQAIQKEALQVGDLNTFRAGHEIQKPKKSYKEANKRIATLIERWDENDCTRDEFLRGIGYNIALNC